MQDSDIEDTVATYAHYAAVWFPGHSETYAQWASGVAADPGLAALVAALPPAKRQPNLVFAAARFLGCPDAGFGGFAAFLRANWPEVRRQVLARRTQTNEAGRCAVLLPVFARIAAEEGKPLALIEVGPSAGLCLLPDKYSYQYDDGARLGSGAPLLRCTTTGHPPLPAALPAVASRTGVDMNPLDGTDPDTVRWLESLVWPGQDHRLSQLRAALSTLASLGDAGPVLLAGDLNEHIAELVRSVPASHTAVVFHSAVLVYLSAQQRARFARTVRGLDCRWVSNEDFHLDNAGRTVPSVHANLFTLALDGEPVAYAGQHGAELHWI